MSGRPFCRLLLFLLACWWPRSACKEEGGVKVSSFTFKGTKAVTPAQLKSVLATAASSKIPWGTKHYFSREQFEADLKRIVAFYKDRGYPDARVTSFDAKLNDDADVGRASPSTSTRENRFGSSASTVHRLRAAARAASARRSKRSCR